MAKKYDAIVVGARCAGAPTAMLLARSGFHIDDARLNGDWTLPTKHDESVKAAWLGVYEDPSQHWALYELAK